MFSWWYTLFFSWCYYGFHGLSLRHIIYLLFILYLGYTGLVIDTLKATSDLRSSCFSLRRSSWLRDRLVMKKAMFLWSRNAGQGQLSLWRRANAGKVSFPNLPLGGNSTKFQCQHLPNTLRVLLCFEWENRYRNEVHLEQYNKRREWAKKKE